MKTRLLLGVKRANHMTFVKLCTCRLHRQLSVNARVGGGVNIMFKKYCLLSYVH